MTLFSGGEWCNILNYMQTDGDTFPDLAETDFENKKKEFNGSEARTNITVHGLWRSKIMREMIFIDNITVKQ